MVNTTTAPKAEIVSDRWVKATWDEFLALADDPKLETGRFYYDNHKMRIEMSPVGPIHAHENSIVSNVVRLFATIRNIHIYEYTNCSFRKKGESECQPDIAFYLGADLKLPPRNNAPVDLNKFDLPTLIVEISSTTLQDDLGYKRLLYERLGILEYWVVNAQTSEVFAFTIADGRSGIVERSQVLEGLEITTVQEALKRSQTEDDGAIARWLLQTFNG
ncbi:Uma2 family endonuclease [Phormidium tenue]|uniref:Uma2 family endonuclease n=1 Tax=Phormidium tenue FACHB-1050 TaxID=2692857 RepID=A0ABR8CDQ7_9CYAN|nr:Uma2 family endonuclease [Phormidium tenue]MBD2318433.1 Uma2 family endonuclease [Phormidium tenue FACHB-1050]